MAATESSNKQHGEHPSDEQRRIYRHLQARIDRQQRRRQLKIERLIQQQRDRRLRSFRRPTR